MKILQVTSFFSPVHGGAAEVPYQLSKALTKRGHQVTIYTGDHKLGLEYLSSIPGVEVYSFKTWLSWARFYITPGMIKKAKEELKHFDVVHLHNYRTFQNIVVYHYLRKYHIPYIVQSHEWLFRKMSRQRLKQVYDTLWGYRLLRDASRVIAVAQPEVRQYQAIGASADQIEVIPNGIELSEFDNLPRRGEFRSKYGLADKQKIILYLGRIHKNKGPDLLAKAYADITRSSKDTKLVIVGPDDGYLPSLKKLIADLEITDNVLFTGPLYGQEKLQAYVDADIYVLVSIYETFGITVLEALACGTPVIVTDRCGIANAVNHQAGLVVPYDTDQLRGALLQMLGNDKMRRQLGQKGKLLVREQFNWDKIAEQFEHVYETCCRR